MKPRSILNGMLLLSTVVVLLFGCSSSKGFKTIQGDPEPLYKQGLSLFNRRNYPEALKKFEELKSSFPDSPPYTTWAELKVGDCHFLSGSFVEAIAAYEEFKKIHPTHEEMPYVQYQIGMSYFKQIVGIDRDQNPTRKALSSFEYLIANYPSSLFTEKTKDKIWTCRKQLAEQEFYIGNYYYNRGDFLAAARRFEGLLQQYPKTVQEDRTLFLLGRSYVELNQTEMAKRTFTKLVTDYPNSRYSKEAKMILDRGITSKELSVQKAAASGPLMVEPTDTGRVNVALVRFEDEGRQPLSLTEERKMQVKEAEGKGTLFPVTPAPAVLETPKSVPSKEVIVPNKEVRSEAVPRDVKQGERSDEALKIAFIPAEEGRKGIPPKVEPKIEPTLGEGTQKTSSPVASSAPQGMEKPRRGIGALETLGQEKIVDSGQPIDITSDKVESYTKDNLIIFKGNVTARQKDIVIYADSIEAVIVEGGRGIEKVVADGNVKVQQGLRVANCQKAVFYNLDKKVVLTGDPKLWEGDNVVSGETIVFDIEQNRVDVKGGPGGRGKVKIQP
ncbi:MAG: lipopolysaccharide transport periplasmic protein LptA [Deltaproteobacteria bacterium RBG_13_52_11b]|nr:MAG: lipopolysaccharide transport periplasmic protein LptA [Deltaproteobacteria bacterium RBG_13_52_11b]